MTRDALARGLRSQRTLVLMGVDAVALFVGYLIAVWARYGSDTDSAMLGHWAVVVVAAIALHWVVGTWFAVYRGRYGVATIDETVFLGWTALTAGVIVFVANSVIWPSWIARSVPLGGTFLALCLMVLGRAWWRQQSDNAFAAHGGASRTLVIGAGFSGSRLVHSMLGSPESGMTPVGFLDDDPWKRHRRHYGVAVLGTVADFESVVAEHDVESVVIAVSAPDRDLLKPLTERALALGVTVKVLPSLAESMSSGADVRDVRDINMHDVLGRAAVETDLSAIAGYVTGKRVLVTGAGGSIGSELCRQIDGFAPAELIMLDRDESALHSVQLSLRGRALLDSPDVVLCDIRDKDVLAQIFADRRPEVVFHAAALKHLPMLEQYPHEGFRTNVLGTANTLEAALQVGVETFVNISTDKAADPTSVLGATKRTAERLTAGAAGLGQGTYLSVRFGNVLGSRGSVLHAFTAQIAAGGPITVTHPDITRYFMTVEEAVQLVIQAGAIGSAGEVMILDMGEPMRIQDMAEQLIALSGKKIEIVHTGLREGEKLHERLFGDTESYGSSVHPLISTAEVAPLVASEVAQFDLRSDAVALRSVLSQWASLRPVNDSSTAL